MDIGKSLRPPIEQLFQQNKSDIIVYKDYEHDKQNVLEFVGMKNNEKGRSDKVMFQFLEYVDIEVGDVLQQKHARTLWKVYELDENIVGNTLLFFEVKVRKLDAMTSIPRSVTITNVSGNVQIGGHNAQQSIAVNNAVNNAINELQELVKEGSFSEEQKESLADALDVIANAIDKDKTPTLLERIHKKISLISDIFQRSKELAITSVPFIKTVCDYYKVT